MTTIADIRKDYMLETLDESGTSDDPISQFTKWWHEAIASNIDEVNAMTLSTVGKNNKPSSRIVLLKGYSAEGFIFYTNYQSHKGRDLENNPYASLVFFWKELERQVRIEGKATKTSEEESEAYFNSRPKSSQLGAWASQQSEVIESREMLEDTEDALIRRYGSEIIPKPPHWGGYIIHPEMVEFWQGRPSRLHDRIRYNRLTSKPKTGADKWLKVRLAP